MYESKREKERDRKRKQQTLFKRICKQANLKFQKHLRSGDIMCNIASMYSIVYHIQCAYARFH